MKFEVDAYKSDDVDEFSLTEIHTTFFRRPYRKIIGYGSGFEVRKSFVVIGGKVLQI